MPAPSGLQLAFEIAWAMLVKGPVAALKVPSSARQPIFLSILRGLVSGAYRERQEFDLGRQVVEMQESKHGLVVRVGES